MKGDKQENEILRTELFRCRIDLEEQYIKKLKHKDEHSDRLLSALAKTKDKLKQVEAERDEAVRLLTLACSE